VLRAGGSTAQCASAFLCRALSGKRKDRMIVSTRLNPPAAHCFVCGSASVTVQLDLRTATGALLVQEVLIKKLAFHQPNLTKGDRGLYESGDLDEDEVAIEEAKLGKLLTEPPFSLRTGAMLNVSDQSQSLDCELIVVHAEIDVEAHPLGFIVHGADSIGVRRDAGGAGSAGPSGANAGDDSDIEMLDSAPVPASDSTPTARKQARSRRSPSARAPRTASN